MKNILKTILLGISVTLLVTSISVRAQPITFNFEGVDINTFISQVSELTGKNFIVDPTVRGKITVISSKALSGPEVYQVFLSVLSVHGYSAVPSGTIIKIVPNTKAKQDTIPTGEESTGNQMVTRVIQVKNVSAGQLTRILRPLTPSYAHIAAYNATNTLVITDRANNVNRLMKIIRKIDKVSDSEVDIVALTHASASEVVRILKKLQRFSLKGKNLQRSVRLAADLRTNSVLLSGEKSARIKMRAIIADMDTSLNSGGNTHVIYLHYVNAKKMVKILSGVSKTIGKKNKRGRFKQKTMAINIQADEDNNALVITAPPDIFRSLQLIIKKLDIRRAQVLIEAIIVDISVDKARELGVQWILGGRKSGSKQGAIATSNYSGASNGGIINLAQAAASGNIPSVGDGLNLLLGRFGVGKPNIGVLISALKSDTGANILSTPSILTLDNKKAEIKVGQNVPFVTGQFSNNGASNGSVNPFQTIQRQDIGIKLIVKPQINEGNTIMLEIDQEVSSISPSTTASDIVTNKRTIKTTVMVENGEMVVLGGLIDERLTQVKRKVPILGSIPLLGKLFQYNKTSKEKRNLMVFLRPVIIKDKATQRAITHGKYTFMRGQQLKLRKKGIPLLPDIDSPVLKKYQGMLNSSQSLDQLESEVDAKLRRKKAAKAARNNKSRKSNYNNSNYYEGDPVDETKRANKKSISKNHPAKKAQNNSASYFENDPTY